MTLKEKIRKLWEGRTCSVSLSQGTAELFPCVRERIFGRLRAGVLDFSPGSLSDTLILLSGRNYSQPVACRD